MVFGLLRWLVTVAIFVALAVWLARNPGMVSVQWLGWRADTNVPFLLMLLVLSGGFVFWLYGMLRRIVSLPSTVGSWMERRRLKEGVAALGYGYAAALAGDAVGLRRAVRTARRDLGSDSAVLLLSAQSAEIAGDHAAAANILAGLLDVPEVRPAALKSLARMAGRSGRHAEQRRLVQEAFDLNPRLDWAASMLLECQVRDHDWEEALSTAELGQKLGVLEWKQSVRAVSAFRTAYAETLLEQGDTSAARRNARKAMRQDRHFLPAVLTLVRALGREGAPAKGMSLIRDVWPDMAHSALAAAFLELCAREPELQRVARVKTLTDRAPSHPESVFLLATVSLEAKLWGQARSALEGLYRNGLEDPRLASLMALVEEDEKKDSAKAALWLRRAAQWSLGRSPDPTPVSARAWLSSVFLTAAVPALRSALPAPRPETGDGADRKTPAPGDISLP
ncbi:hypothetical protein HEQ62_06005 [Haematospirillum jordaniae]|uniref:HemY N-terminal domain-containing protein n=1 Tax=Haematospirillum jordaniae TaxID=1549855 RepID=A0A143DDN3_9PROT|nr:heme biosynthesis HemY N-terminal domain-containing protein [Haematospirillum jordaniae]AMW34238.1 hypothetical protein AY555_02530 [Haematospirillum jordaniae]NKD59330.1 hypothetical protein [Haematospirillum jordaniae]NKD67023.1 hypothetical protein [Haematospirillum jordaniae]NKD81687.1 hypothetical protein [Haematospirillum jordaniae]NKD90050.1 hypothetical protein [Haematospirillum jordaniae]